MRGLGLVVCGVVAPLGREEVESWAPGGGTCEVVEGDEQDWRALQIAWGEDVIRLTRSIPGDGRFQGQVRGLIGAANRADVLNSGRTGGRSILVGQRCASAWQLVAVASLSSEGEGPLPEGWELLLRRIAQRLNGIVFREGAFLDHELRLFLAPGQTPQTAAALPVLEDALDRATGAEKRISLFKLEPPPLPPLPGSEEIQLRPAAEVAARAQALWAVATVASGVEPAAASELLASRGIGEVATPSEAAYLAGRSEKPHGFAHRKEALHTLLWALDRVELLSAPRHEADFEELTRRMRRLPGTEFVEKAQLRPTAEILEEVAVHYACHGALSMAGGSGESLLRVEVVRERALSLLWLIQHLRQDWDTLEGSL
ncbi:MAG: DUF4272 domain-containing protein [Planctomycetes bacterium]|nr:DUF4272 domain-containing protein [Planctomycetota bacterium]